MSKLNPFMRVVCFAEYLKECGEKYGPYWESQYFLLKEGVMDGRIHDSAFAVWDRMKYEGKI